MKEEKAEGIVLRCQEYQEKNRIISVFTPTAGLVQLIVKGISGRSPHLMTLTTPFTCAEFHYIIGRSGLFRFSEGSTLDENLILRDRFESLQAAGIMTQALLKLLLPESPDPPLYALYKVYLKQIPTFQDTSPLVASFRLKILRHEGILDWEAFSLAEKPQVEALVSARDFATLRNLSIPPNLKNKINNLT